MSFNSVGPRKGPCYESYGSLSICEICDDNLVNIIFMLHWVIISYECLFFLNYEKQCNKAAGNFGNIARLFLLIQTFFAVNNVLWCNAYIHIYEFNQWSLVIERHYRL